MTAIVRARARRAVGRAGRWDVLDVVPRLSLLLLIFNAGKDPVVMVAGALLTAVAFPRPHLYRDGRMWLGAGTTLLLWNAVHWQGLDNHVWLTTWWTIGLGCALLTPSPRRSLALVGRLLVGLAFLLAVVWKVTSGEYLDGRFFTFSLLLDDRFRWITEGLGGIDAAAYERNFDGLGRLRTQGGAVGLATTARIDAIALILTWWTLAIEAAIAGAFLAWRGQWRRWARPASIAVFCLTTYAAVPVSGFGTLLVVMELPDDALGRRGRWWFIAGFAALALWPFIWRALFY